MKLRRNLIVTQLPVLFWVALSGSCSKDRGSEKPDPHGVITDGKGTQSGAKTSGSTTLTTPGVTPTQSPNQSNSAGVNTMTSAAATTAANTTTSNGPNNSSGVSSTGTSGTATTNLSTLSSGTQSSTSTAPTNSQGQLLCGSKVWACGDGIDNDNDGLIDLDDPECTSPCDDTEETFATALPGQNSDCKADCYFDANSGGGDDKCDFQLKCDPQNPGRDVGCTYDPTLTACTASTPQVCLDACLPQVPNGCDCFGCCEVQTSGGSQFIYLGSGSTCNMKDLNNCASCTFNSACANTCDRQGCELCFGDTALPAHCTESACPNGVQSCTTTSDCGGSSFCLTGCCVYAPG